MRSQSRFRLFAAVAGWFVFSLALYAGDARRTTVYHLQDGETIQLDGYLNERIWREQPTIGGFIQAEPRPGEDPSEQTEVRVAYDENALYIAVHCFDSSPEKILAREMSRDARLFNDDNIQILIDTFDDGRNAYYFQTNALGALVDGRITESSRPDTNWDGIWNVQARVVEDGWTAEFEIPFKTLSFQPGNSTWGFNVERRLARVRERSRWASPSLDHRFNQVSMAGAIDGFEGLSQGIGLDIKPYGLIGFARDIEADDRTTIPADVGVDIFYRVTSNLISSTTINTDFAETEVDTRQVNLTRFSRFFPEKRSFFLEDAGIFSFGLTASQRGRGGGGGGRGPRPDLVPFFSRRIGLVDNEVVPILVGQKLTGKVGRFDLGILDVVTGETDVLARQNLFVARTKMNFWQESYVGALVTHGDPSGETSNSLIGADVKLSTSDFLSSEKRVAMEMYGSKTQTPELLDDDTAYGFRLSYPNDFVSAEYQWQQIGENYNPELGFVLRNGIRKTSFRGALNPRPEKWNIRQMRFSTRFEQYYNIAHQTVESREVSFTPLRFEFENGANLSYRVRSSLERLFEPFDITDDVIIPVGEYTYLTHRFGHRTTPTVPWQFDIDYEFGSFYSGHSKQLSGEVSWQNASISARVDFDQYWVTLAEGSFTTQLALFRFDYSFSPLTTVSSFVQYDTESRNIGLQSRLRWIIKPGNEVFFVVNHGWQRDIFDRFESITTDVRAKINYTFRF